MISSKNELINELNFARFLQKISPNSALYYTITSG